MSLQEFSLEASNTQVAFFVDRIDYIQQSPDLLLANIFFVTTSEFPFADGTPFVEGVNGELGPRHPTILGFNLNGDVLFISPLLGIDAKWLISQTDANGNVPTVVINRNIDISLAGASNPNLDSEYILTLHDEDNKADYLFRVFIPHGGQFGRVNDARCLVTVMLDTTNGAPPTLNAGLSPSLPSLLPILTMCRGSRRYVILSCPDDGKRFHPRIFIEATSTARDTDFGAAFFTVIDNHKHNGTYNGKNRRLGKRVWESQFSQLPQFNYIMKGKGVNLYQKFRSIIRHYKLNQPIENFTAHMALYVYLRYFLSRLLWGEFDTDFLSRCLNRKFLHDLARSQYRDFLIVFEDSEIGVKYFYRYFRCVRNVDDECEGEDD